MNYSVVQVVEVIFLTPYAVYWSIILQVGLLTGNLDNPRVFNLCSRLLIISYLLLMFLL
jgi:hypothetical protein